MLSSTGYGHTGPWRDYVVYGWALEPMTISHLTGYSNGPPLATAVPYTDIPAALYGALSILAAVEHHRRTGQGQWIDLSQYEVGVCAVGEAVLDYTMNGNVQTRTGNRHPVMAPHNCYRCRGKDKWITIAVSNDKEWQALCSVMDNSSLIKDRRFADAEQRKENENELDRLIEEWTVKHDNMELMDVLQKAGVRAGAVLTNKELLLNRHLKERKFFHKAVSPAAGARFYPGPWFNLSKTPGSIRKAAPNLGQDNQKVLTEILGLSKEEIFELEKNDIIGTMPPWKSEEEREKAAPKTIPLDLQAQLGLIADYDDDFYEILQLEKIL